MRMKYYLRGMGVGIVVTVLLFMVALIFYTPEISDAEIIRRAKLLGMVDGGGSQTVSEDMADNDTDLFSETDPVAESEEPGASDDTTSDAEDDADSDAGSDEMAYDAGESVTTTNDSDTAASSDDTVIVTSEHPVSEGAPIAGSVVVRSGDSSESVSRKLFDAGFVDSASDFNDFLVSGRYDRVLQNGTFDIPEGASYEEIAKIITKKQ